MYTLNAMLNLINLTQARNNLSKLIDEVFTRKKTYILIRDSIPQAVIMPYDEYQFQQKKWQEEVERLMSKGKKVFRRWLKERQMKLPKSKDEIYRIINQVAGRR